MRAKRAKMEEVDRLLKQKEEALRRHDSEQAERRR